MKTKIILTLLLLITGLSVTAQTIFKGVVVDAQSKQPVTNAKIGITNQGVGVVSNASGAYIYKKYQETLSDTDRLIISAPGYDTIELEAKEVRTLLNRNSTTQLEKSSKTNAVGKIKNVKVFWDISEGMQDRNLEQELAIVQQYLDRLGDVDVTLHVFNNKIIATEKWKTWDGDMARFRESVTQTTYDGPSNYSILNFDGADAIILASNGEPNYGKLAVSQGQPVYSISSTQTTEGLDYLESLSLYTSGSVLRLKDNSNQQVATTTAVTTTSTKNIIEGKITSLGEPVSGATLMVNGNLAEYFTNSEGVFKIPASTGDILFVRALGLFPKKVLVSINDLNIDLIPGSDQLDEVVITEKREKIIVGNKEMRGLKVPNVPGGVTPSGDFYITADDIEPDAKTLDQILREKFAGITLSQDPYNGSTILINGRSPQWVLNGVLLRFQPPPLYLSDTEIESIVVKEPDYETSRYGELLSGDAIIVTTKSTPLARAKRVNSALVKSNDYTETVPSLDNVKNIISGTVTGSQGPIQGAEVLRKGSFEMATTASDGSFKLNAKDGDVLIVSALGMYPKQINLFTETDLKINLLAVNDVLDEVVVTGEASRNDGIINNRVNLSTGRYKVPGVGNFDVLTLTDKDINFAGAASLGQALTGKIAGVIVSRKETYERGPRETINLKPWIDGRPVSQEEFFSIPADLVKSVSVKRRGFGNVPASIFIETRINEGRQGKEESLLVKNNDYTEEIEVFKNNLLRISGIVESSQKPIHRAEVSKKGSLQISYTNADGSFTIDAVNGDILNVTAFGMFSKKIVVTDKKQYRIDMVPNGDLLDAVEIEGRTQSQEELDQEEQDRAYASKSYAQKVFTIEELSKTGGSSLVNLIAGKVSGVILNQNVLKNPRTGAGYLAAPYAVVLNNQLYEQDVLDFIDPVTIQKLEVISGVQGAVRYGSGARNGIIVVETLTGADIDTSKIKPSALVTGNDYEEDSAEKIPNLIKITGTVVDAKGPLKDVAITQKGSFNEVYSSEKGEFFINSKLDEILVISASGMFPKEIRIDRQDLGIIKLTPKTNDLDAIVLEGQERVDNTVETAEGKINADKLGYTAKTLEGNDFSSGYTNLRQLITGKVPGVDVAGGLYSGSEVVYKIRGGTQSINTEKPPIWIINGTPYQDVPNFLDVQQIKSITVLKSVVATSRYGSLAAGGAFLIKTKEADFKNKAASSNQSALVSGNEYTGNVTGNIDAALPSYIIRFRESGTPQDQIALYKKLSRTQESPLEYYVDAAQYFQTLDPTLGDEVRSDLAYIARNNTKALRTLSYLYELVNDTKNVVLVNERIIKIAPQEAQSYRDLALAYQNNRQYDKALELYINMLGEQILGVNFDGLENPLRSELSRLVALHKDKIDYTRLPNEWLRADFKRDIRMVIDWSDRSVPFEFQFVNPDKKFFKWTHTLEETRERLEMEQKQGFQTEEFIIDDAPSGEWIINIQYLGDEGDYALPPFLKYTVYRNYGTPQETKEIRVVKLFKQVDKVTLGRLTM